MNVDYIMDYEACQKLLQPLILVPKDNKNDWNWLENNLKNLYPNNPQIESILTLVKELKEREKYFRSNQ